MRNIHALDDTAARRDTKNINAAIPTENDMPGYVASRGNASVLSPLSGDRNGKAVLTGSKLDDLCETYREEDDGWACQGSQGMA